ncbi:LPS export ABC transporter periplasmic protein LptC [Chamaesiphon sp. OTE_20_metabat_361]|uniref:LPS export ABC transporter periplasmic protein LptC n=1 Tax=Chamaesiphon sp. OTE_20_metabat_361 TaxID=2964689 RepID=UPI00286CED84|nr:LPS export ABC transporter periplasmic protein LptC [Chamaesiphon sp. OTE_20_metabat_361]
MTVDRWIGLGLTIAIASISSCRPAPKPPPSPKPKLIAARLELDNLSFEQVDKQGKPLWKVRAERGVYTPDGKRAKITNLSGDLYQDGKVVLRIVAKAGEVEQDGEKVLLSGDVVATETRNNLVMSGQTVEWQPKADLLTIRDRVQANQPKFQVNATEGRYVSRKQQLDLNGKITAVATEPRLAMQTEHLTWLVKDQKVIGDRLAQMQRYRGSAITERVTTNRFSTVLDRKIVNLQGQVRLNAVNPLIQVDGESFGWDLDRELVTADRPLTILYPQEALVFTASTGELALKAATATLAGNAIGTSSRNQARLRSDRLIWQISSQQLTGTGNVVYQQINPAIKFTGTRGIGKLQDRSIVVSSDGKQRVQTEFIPN